ncbi:MAG: undecaprenyl/decaprenyl-phosphate alpha-N-acetylglucosaminyl 1-phosphate transferase [Phycisphaerae bacterium]|nr:undecaprenyl/decaprenyl-phosphate alpha-N-acetylglucosaminyl 1-phosphate transferase [Phycisphaerae bacterium]
MPRWHGNIVVLLLIGQHPARDYGTRNPTLGRWSAARGNLIRASVDSVSMLLALFAGTCVGALTLSIVMTGIIRAWAIRVDFVDRPGAHKQHAAPVAQGGGIAIALSVLLPLLAGVLGAWLLTREGVPTWVPDALGEQLYGAASKLPQVLAIVGGVIVLHVVGLLDDRTPMGPGPKFLAEFLVAGVIAGPCGIRAFEFLPSIVSFVVTVIWIVLITNAFNFLDNMDGLSAGVAAIAAVTFAVASLAAGQLFVPLLALLVASVSLGFLLWNFHPARIFMGDAGSLVLGFLMSLLTILVTFYDPRQDLQPFGVLVPLVVLAVPLYDVISVVVRRLRLGISPLRGDRRHFSHRLVRRGMSIRAAVLTIYLATAATALPSIVLARVDWLAGSLLLVQSICVVGLIALLEDWRETDPHSEPPRRTNS